MTFENEEDLENGLSIQLFGAFDVRMNGAPIPPLRSRKVQWLLALLILRHDQSLDRVWLAGTLWPDSTHSQALYNLRQSLSNLRHALGTDCLHLQTPTVNALSLEIAPAAVDVLRFDAAITSGESAALERAIGLYRGPLLEGCAEEWIFSERRVREENYLSALENLADRAIAHGEGSLAVTYLRSAIQTDPFRERAQRALIQALANVGEVSAAIQTYRDLRLLLRRELNTDPDPETVTLFQHIRAEARRQTQFLPVAPPKPRAEAARFLPTPWTDLVGRTSEVAQIVTTLRTVRLLTLTGPGGVGKTRLAIAAAEQMAEAYPEGVFFVDLAPLSDPALVMQVVATVLQVREEPGCSLSSTLQEHLHSKTLLLLLDNCEHLLDSSASLVDALLRNCSGVRILATSRQTLGLTGEVVWTVPPLSAPALADLACKRKRSHKDWLSELSEYEAVRLFVIRAQQASPSFQMSAQNAEVVAQICAHLDGMPLALELAAARVRSLSVEEIYRKLNNRFRLLTGGSRAALPRQQTLRALMDWSYDLLDDSEKALLCRLSAFAGGWTLEAAERVCTRENSEREEAFEEWEVQDLLTSLVDKSLVMAEQEAGQTRYRLLETIQQYAQERLRERNEVDVVRRRHQAFFVVLAEEAEPQLKGPQQSAWLYRLEQDHDNLRHALTGGSQEAALRITGALWRYLLVKGYFSEGREWLAGALAGESVQEGTPVRAKALHGAGVLAWSQGDHKAARTLQEESLALYRELGDKVGVANTFNILGNIVSRQGHFAEAQTFYSESLALRRELGDKLGIATLLNNLGNIAREQGDQIGAQTLYSESLALRRELGDKQGIASTLNNLGNVACDQKEYATARKLHEEGLALRRELGSRLGIANALYNLGGVAFEQGDSAAARLLYKESLSLHRELANSQGIAFSLEGFGALALREAQARRAARLWAAAGAFREAIDAPLPPSERNLYEALVAQTCAALGRESFALAWSEGRSLTVEQAMEYALSFEAYSRE